MKKILFALYIVSVAGLFISCEKDTELNPNSIFETDPPLRNEFDEWLLKNYTDSYNVEFKYRLEDLESSLTHTLAPADYNKSIAMAKLVKYLWFEAYVEARDIAFIRQYTPKTIMLVGSGAYNSEGTMILGTAEGGLKVTLYLVNNIDPDNLVIADLNYYYFKTMHHEFGHILHQNINYDPNFKLISEADYVSGNWYQQSNTTAYTKGFVSPYAMNQPDEDFVETFAIYLTSTPAAWNAILTAAGSTGRPIIEQKFGILKKYLNKSWNIDIDNLRNIIQRRTQEVFLLDLNNLN
jgi:substrate import-associated zinc metallohydrolase lipoprotein